MSRASFTSEVRADAASVRSSRWGFTHEPRLAGQVCIATGVVLAMFPSAIGGAGVRVGGEGRRLSIGCRPNRSQACTGLRPA
jgi:hypothetical protein